MLESFPVFESSQITQRDRNNFGGESHSVGIFDRHLDGWYYDVRYSLCNSASNV